MRFAALTGCSISDVFKRTPRIIRFLQLSPEIKFDLLFLLLEIPLDMRDLKYFSAEG